MAIPAYVPALIDGLDDMDNLIYHLRFRKHLTFKAVAAEVGMSHTGVRHRVKRMLGVLRPDDWDELRDQEGIRLDELRNQVIMLAELALTAEQPDVDLALRAFKEAHAITRTYSTIYGLERRPDDRPAATPDRINELLGAYVQGVADGATTQKAPAE